MVVRRAINNDLNEILEIINETKRDFVTCNKTGWNDEYPTISDIIQDIETNNGFVLSVNKEVIGYIAISNEEEIESKLMPPGKNLYLLRLVIKENKRGNGYARHLLQKMYYYACKNGYDNVAFLVNPNNDISIRIYNQLGYISQGMYTYPWGNYYIYTKKTTKVLKMISWNVNGLRACMTKGFNDFLNSTDPDIIALQEIKMFEKQADFSFDQYHAYWNSAEKPGYSGTLILSKEKPIHVSTSFVGTHPNEGRVLTVEYPNYFFVDLYVPNVSRDLSRMSYRLKFEEDLRSYLTNLALIKKVIVCGDLNVAHNLIDVKNAKANIGNAGFTNEERDAFSKLLNCGFVDSFRYLYPHTIAYSWWSYMFQARLKDVGWRIDYFLVSNSYKEQLLTSFMHQETLGSDHCPVEILIKDE